MSTITAVSGVSLNRMYGSRTPLPQPQRGKDLAAGGDRPPGGQLNQLSSLTGTDSDTLGSMSSARQLVSLMQEKGVDLGLLRNVLNSGELLDVTA